MHGSDDGPVIYDLQTTRGWGYVVGLIGWFGDAYTSVDFGLYLGDNALAVWNAVQAK